ncbi:MAG: ABC transporter permease [Acidobacteria bacterium]|nr:ABC transporter permease [Acidobacteriota bacterium]
MRPLRNWFRRGDLESGLDRELAYHLDRRISDLVNSGLSEAEARRQAKLELGGATQIREDVRDVWFTRWLRDLAYDLRFSARSFLRSPTFTATIVLSLALGIGATTAIYSLVDQVVLRALPVPEPERLVLIDWVGEQAAAGRGSTNLMSYPICLDLQQQERFFSGVLCRHETEVNLSTGGEAREVGAELVSGTYFAVLGVGPALGRLLNNEDAGAAGAHPVVVLSYDYWQAQLAGAPDVIGRKVLVNSQPMTVVGVAAATFRGIDVGKVPSLWIPVSMTSAAMPGWNPLTDRRTRWMQVLGRLRSGVSREQAQAGLQPWFKAMLEEDTRRADFPRITTNLRAKFLASTIGLTPAPQGHSSLRRRLSQPLWVLLAATALLLGLACLNVAGLFLARGSARGREITTRMALGASRARIGRQLLADSLVFALAGGALGILLAPFALKALISFLPNDGVANNLQSSIDGRVLLFTMTVSLVAGLLSGLGPALQAGRDSLILSLRSRGDAGIGGIRLRRMIITAQIAFTLVLVTGAALFVRTLTGLMDKGPGFSTSSLVSFGIQPRRSGYTSAEAGRLTRRLHDAIRNLPTTQSAALSGVALLEGGSWNNFMTIAARERITTDRVVHLNSVSTEYFSTLGIKLVAGRSFNQQDTSLIADRGVRTAVINQTMAKRYFGDRSPIGALLGFGREPGVKPDIEIVGVVADSSYRALREESDQAFFPILEGSDSGGHFYVRVRGTQEAAFQAIRAALHDTDPTLPIAYFRTLDEQVNRSLSTERMLATVSGGFGVLALLLSLVGLYGVMSFVVTQRTREIGVRLALGATRGAALWLVLRDAARMIAAGTVIALPCVWALGRLVESQLYGVTSTDAASVAAATAILVFTGLGAALIPAYRAASIDPTEALRFE